MKIIGITTSGFILESSKTEINNLCGYSYPGDAPSLTIGDEIEIHKMFEQLWTMEVHDKERTSMVKKLHMIASSLEKIEPLTLIRIAKKVVKT